jgi:PhnB protein
MSTTAAEIPMESAAQRPVLAGPIAYLIVDGARKAAEFYKRAFGAEESGCVKDDDSGRTMHIHLYVNNGSLMLSDAFPEHGVPLEKPQGFMLHLQVDDVEAAWQRAVEAGADIVMPLEIAFWGDRYGQLRDPFGVLWSLGGPPEPRRSTN